MTKEKIKDILDMMDTLQEHLLSLPDDMLLNIDPRDNESLENGLSFIKAFNDNLNQFVEVSNKIASQVKIHLSINPEEDELEQESSNRQKRDRIIKELDKSSPHNLDEDFTYKRPYGFVLDSYAIKGLKTWKNLYLHVLHYVNDRSTLTFKKLLIETRFVSKRGNPLFSASGKELRVAEKIEEGFFIEVNLSANMIRNNIKEILQFVGIDYTNLKIYLREDRDAKS